MDNLEDKFLLLFTEYLSKKINDDDDARVQHEDVSVHTTDLQDDFWESQLKLVENMFMSQQFLCPRSMHELSLRRHIGIALRNFKEGILTDCSVCARRPDRLRCTSCLRKIVCNHLQRHGYRAAICRSEWKARKNIPKGQHEYIEVIIEASPYRKDANYKIDLEFRAEFELAKPRNGYRKIVDRLPEVYVGKPDRLRVILRAVCEAMQRSLEENKMHVGPWRKFGFVQMKWLRPNVTQVVHGGSVQTDMLSPSELRPASVSDAVRAREPLSRTICFTCPMVKAMV